MFFKKKIQNWSDSDLAKAVKSGDMAAYEELFHRYYFLIVKFIERLVGEREAAEDIVQNVFIRLWLGRERLDPEQSVKNLLYVSARNGALDVLKSRKADVISIHKIIGAAEPEASSDNPETYMDTVDIIQKISGNFMEMPSRRRLIFRMSRYEHLSNNEIAEKLGLSVRTVEKHIQLALRDLRKHMN